MGGLLACAATNQQNKNQAAGQQLHHGVEKDLSQQITGNN